MRTGSSRARAAATALAGAVLLAACAVGPNYKRPVVIPASAYKEQDGWKPSEPADALTRGPWWLIFNDPLLSELEAKIDINNNTVKAAAAQVEEARALVRQAEAGFWPSLSATGLREKTATDGLHQQTLYQLGGNASWTIDIWGQIRRTVEGDVASAQASEAALAAARLLAQADLATDYFELRAQDQLVVLLVDFEAAQERSLKITMSRYRVGVAYKADVLSAQTQLLSSQAQQVNAGVQRGILEHAIAVLIGEEPAKFSVAVTKIRTDVPTVPPGVPSTLLERRPDVAQAERAVAAANAQIGVAISSFFPSLTLTGSTEYLGSPLHKLIRASNDIWAFGPSLALTIFDGGLRLAQVAQARATFNASVDSYRQTVLVGFQQVEDQLVTLRVLEKQAVIEEALVKAAREAEDLTLNQYKAGTVPYSSVITAQTTRITAEETALTIFQNRLTASVALIQALGGGWDASALRH
jgi:NodT family efflux transporter outer membrane factor (OMF) lipoprotein